MNPREPAQPSDDPDPLSSPGEFDPHDPDGAALEHAIEVLSAHCEGYLRIDDQGFVLKYILDPQSGRLVAPVPVAVFFSAEHILFVPEESDDALQLR